MNKKNKNKEASDETTTFGQRERAEMEKTSLEIYHFHWVSIVLKADKLFTLRYARHTYDVIKISDIILFFFSFTQISNWT